jgi:hypothetical protein
MRTDENLIDIIDDDKTIECYYLYYDEKKLLAKIDRETRNAVIYPINTHIASSDFMKPKYSVNFKFEGYDIDYEESETEERDTHGKVLVLRGLPKVFTKTVYHGLGLRKEYKCIAEIANEIDGCEFIIISTVKETAVDGRNIIINSRDLDKIRRGLDRTTDFYRSEALSSKKLLIYNEILHNIDNTRFPEKKRIHKKDVVYRLVKNFDFQKPISDTDKNTLLKYKESIDVNYFSVLKTEFDKKIENNHKEPDFQIFFEENPLLLSLFSGSPNVLFKEQAYLSGKSFENKNGQYTDFLYRNKLTNNSYIIEIKCPETLLLEKKSYRSGVYPVSKDLAGAVTQILSQKYQLETDYASLIKNSNDRNIEAYNVQCLLIIGLLKKLDGEDAKERKRSFELFRNNQKNIRIMTYDECQELLTLFLDISKMEISR